MKKNILLALVIVCALVVAGIGGVLAGFSDTEQSVGNTIVTGSLDLKVDGKDDLPYGSGIGALVTIPALQPAGINNSIIYQKEIVVQNMGNSTLPDGNNDTAHLYLKFKNMVCDNVDPGHASAAYTDNWETTPITSQLKLEPELVTEYGGVLYQVPIFGTANPAPTQLPADCETATGQQGDNCTLDDHLMVMIYYDGVQKGSAVAMSTLGEWMYLGQCAPCGVTHTVLLKFYLPQILDATWGGDTGMGFEYWQTNALMNDKLTFDIEFGLTEVAPN